MKHIANLLALGIITAGLATVSDGAGAAGMDTAREKCTAATARLLAATSGLRVDRVTETAYVNVHLKHPAATSILLTCDVLEERPPDVSLHWDGASPPASFWNLVAQHGASIALATLDTVRRGALDCHRQALKDASELASTLFEGLRFECQAFIRNGGGTSVTVYRPSAEEVRNFDGDQPRE